MADVDKQNDDHQKQCNTLSDHHISSLINQISEQLSRMREDDLELTEQLTSLYDNLCHLRQTLTNPPASSNTDISLLPIPIDYQTKPRSDSEPNILSDRQRILTIIDDFQ